MLRRTIRLASVWGAALMLLVAGDALAGKGGGKPGGGGDPGPAPDPAIAFLAGGRLMVMNADGSNQTELLPAGRRSKGTTTLYNHGRPSWSPDASRIAFGSEIDGTPGIYVINVDGTGLTRVADLASLTSDSTSAEGGTKVAWAPADTVAGSYVIAFTDVPAGDTAADLFLLDPDSGAVVNLTETPGVAENHPAWSYDGTRLAVSRDAGVDTGDPIGYDDHDVVVFTLGAVSGIPAIVGELNISDLAGGPINAEDVRQPAWAKTQNKLLVKTGGGAGWYGDFWIVDFTEGAAAFVNLTDGVDQFRLQACWSSDDSRIIYNGSNDAFQNGGSLWTIDVATKTCTELVRRDSSDSTVRTFPDWKR